MGQILCTLSLREKKDSDPEILLGARQPSVEWVALNKRLLQSAQTQTLHARVNILSIRMSDLMMKPAIVLWGCNYELYFSVSENEPGHLLIRWPTRWDEKSVKGEPPMIFDSVDLNGFPLGLNEWGRNDTSEEDWKRQSWCCRNKNKRRPNCVCARGVCAFKQYDTSESGVGKEVVRS